MFVQRDTAALDGEFNNELVVVTDAKDPAFRAIKLTLSGNVIVPARPLPPSVLFGTVRPGDVANRKLQVALRLPGLHSAFRSAVSDNPAIQVELMRNNNPNELDFEVRMLKKKPTGALYATLRLSFDHPELEELSIPVLGMVQGDLVCTPNRFYVGSERRSMGSRYNMRIASQSEAPFRILSIDCPQGVEVKDDSPANGVPGETHFISFHVDAMDEAPLEPIVVHTDRSGDQQVVVPVLE